MEKGHNIHNNKDYGFSIVIPMYNEASNLKPLVVEIIETFQRQSDYKGKLEIIIVDDGSSDNTLKEAQALLKSLPVLRVIHHKIRYGQSAALYTGIRHARFDTIVTMDGDGQNAPQDILKLIKEYLKHKDNGIKTMVIGERVYRKDKLSRRLASLVANKIRNLLLKDKTPDVGCGLKVFSRKLFLNFPYFDHMHRFMSTLAIHFNAQVISIPVHHRPRLSGKTKYRTLSRMIEGVSDLFGVWWLLHRYALPQAKEIDSNEN